MIKKIIFIEPRNIRKGQPSHERISAFKSFYNSEGFIIESIKLPKGILNILNLKKKFNKKHDVLFISMPPFRGWLLFLLFFNNIILDIRDGWSIAIKSGYGATVKPNKIKSFFAQIVERISIRLSLFTITCTPGLQKYLSKISKKPILLITNGVSLENYNKVIELNKNELSEVNDDSNVIAICAGKFSEYGRDKVKTVLNKLLLQFPNQTIQLKIVGANNSENLWLIDYLETEELNRIDLQLIERVSFTEMYHLISSSDIGITIIRDPGYEFGTKIFDYIVCGIPVLNYFDIDNNFTEYFTPYFYPKQRNSDNHLDFFIRENILKRNRNELLKKLS